MTLSRIEARAVAAQAEPYGRIAVVGAGSWGTALATVARRAGREVVIWGRDPEVIEAIRDRSENPKYLPEVALPDGIEATTDMEEALSGAQAVLIVTPSTTLREICAQMRPHMAPGTPVALCAKGIEARTGLLCQCGDTVGYTLWYCVGAQMRLARRCEFIAGADNGHFGLRGDFKHRLIGCGGGDVRSHGRFRRRPLRR